MENGSIRVRRFAAPFSSFETAALRALSSRLRNTVAGISGSGCCVAESGAILCATTAAPPFDASAAIRFVGEWELDGARVSVTKAANSLRVRFGRTSARLLVQDDKNAFLRTSGCMVSFHPSPNDQLYIMAADTASCPGVVGGIYSRRVTSVSRPPRQTSAFAKFAGTWAFGANRVTISSTGIIDGAFPNAGDLRRAPATGVDELNLWYKQDDCRISFTINRDGTL